MNTVEMLDELQNKALHDEKLKNRFLETKKEEDALGAFCRVCRELGYDIYPMDVIQAGDEFYAAMKRSTNGGGENSPKLEGEDDLYEMFFASMEQMEEMDMESTLKDLKERRSIRAYKPEQIKEEELQKILEAGTYAPTGMGMQSPKIVVVQDKETRDYLSELNAKYLGSDSDPFYGAAHSACRTRIQSTSYLCGGRFPCDGKSDECGVCYGCGLLLDSSRAGGV